MKNEDRFKKQVIKIGTSLGVTIPDSNVKFSGLKKGDIIEITYKIVKK